MKPLVKESVKNLLKTKKNLHSGPNVADNLLKVPKCAAARTDCETLTKCIGTREIMIQYRKLVNILMINLFLIVNF